MNKLKLKYKKDRKAFVPDTEVEFPDGYELEIEKPPGFDFKVGENIDQNIQNSREEFIKEFLEDFGIDISSDSFVKLLGSEAKYIMNTSYQDDKRRIIEAVAEKYNGRYNAQKSND